MLLQAFLNHERIRAHAEATIPSRLRLWVTEFGHSGARGWKLPELDGTWLEGLYSGTAAMLLLQIERVDIALMGFDVITCLDESLRHADAELYLMRCKVNGVRREK